MKELLRALFYFNFISGLLMYELLIIQYMDINSCSYNESLKKISIKELFCLFFNIKELFCLFFNINNHKSYKILDILFIMCGCIGIITSTVMHLILKILINIINYFREKMRCNNSYTKGYKYIAYAEDSSSHAIGNYSHAEGTSHAIGMYAHAEGDYSHGISKDSIAKGDYLHAAGINSVITDPHAESNYSNKYNTKFEESNSICNDKPFDEEYAFFIDESIYNKDEINKIRKSITSTINKINKNGFLKITFIYKDISGKNIDEDIYNFMKSMKMAFKRTFTETFIFSKDTGKYVFSHLIYEIDKSNIEESVENIIRSKI